jgi:cytochrome c oxidase subunit 2
VRKFWAAFFIFWPIVAVVSCAIAPWMNWGFPGSGLSATKLGTRIDDLFYLILVIVTVVFIATQVALGYVLWRGAKNEDGEAIFTHGSHNLEVIWTIVPAGILLFIALVQMNVWAEFRVVSTFPEGARSQPIAEVTARQFEWRIRYPAPDRKFANQADVRRWLNHPEPGDLYTVNDLHVPTGRPVGIYLRTADVQHSFFVPEMRVKQDAVPNLVIPVWFEVTQADQYELVCAELCGWGHYKMKGRVWAQPESQFRTYLQEIQREQFDDGIPDEPTPEEGASAALATEVQ